MKTENTSLKIIGNTIDYKNRLIAERRLRKDNKHVVDHRIATEIATYMFNLGETRKKLIECNEALSSQIIENDKFIDEIDDLIQGLQTELNILINIEEPS